ncbi:MAG: hypothetical protein ACTH0H_05715 [Brachybacterium sp.]
MKPGTDQRPLVVAPLDPSLPLHEAVTLGPDELLPLCGPCYSIRTRITQESQREANATQHASPALFDLA